MKVDFKYLGKDYKLDSLIVGAINKYIEEYSKLNDIIEKSNDISTNINNNYYFSKKYQYISLNDEIYSKIFSKIEEILNKISEPREYNDNLEISKIFFKKKIKERNSLCYNNDTWETDFMEEFEVSKPVMSKINDIIYETCIDEYNKPSFAESLLELYDMNR